jgi:hypothetical protein
MPKLFVVSLMFSLICMHSLICYDYCTAQTKKWEALSSIYSPHKVIITTKNATTWCSFSIFRTRSQAMTFLIEKLEDQAKQNRNPSKEAVHFRRLML